MSSVTSIAAPVARATTGTSMHPSFFGLVRGELLKVSRQRSVYIMLLCLAGVISLPYLVDWARSSDLAILSPAQQLAQTDVRMQAYLLILRFFAPLVVIVTTARLIGMEYSGGTIRVVLARGVGRVQLLAAQLLTSLVVMLGVLAFGLALNAVLWPIIWLHADGNLSVLQALDSAFWSDTALDVGTVAIALTVAVLLAMTLAVVGRSVAVGVGGGLAWFLGDNMSVIFFFLAAKLTNSTAWLVATGDLLVPNLNAMPNALLPASLRKIHSLSEPLVPVTGGHTLLIAGIYAAIFLVVSFVLTWRRDVTE
jgi:ABC-type transport system involved in multi-copper enzyme maturation permease subunit